MIVKKPSIFIYTNKPNRDNLKEICAGIEEEGVFFEVFERDESDLSTLAFQAANDSMMGSGIGVSGNAAAMQMKGLPKEKDIESYQIPTVEECRKIGANSARAIKKMAFK